MFEGDPAFMLQRMLYAFCNIPVREISLKYLSVALSGYVSIICEEEDQGDA